MKFEKWLHCRCCLDSNSGDFDWRSDIAFDVLNVTNGVCPSSCFFVIVAKKMSSNVQRDDWVLMFAYFPWKMRKPSGRLLSFVMSKKDSKVTYCIERKRVLRWVHVSLRLSGMLWLIQLDYVLIFELFARKTPLSLVFTTHLFDYLIANEELSLRFFL